MDTGEDRRELAQFKHQDLQSDNDHEHIVPVPMDDLAENILAEKPKEQSRLIENVCQREITPAALGDAPISVSIVLPSGRLVLELQNVDAADSVGSLFAHTRKATRSEVSALVASDGRKLNPGDSIDSSGLGNGSVVTAVLQRTLEARLEFGVEGSSEGQILFFPDDGEFENAANRLHADFYTVRDDQTASHILDLLDKHYQHALVQQPDAAEHLLSILRNATSAKIVETVVEGPEDQGRWWFHRCSALLSGHRLIMKQFRGDSTCIDE